MRTYQPSGKCGVLAMSQEDALVKAGGVIIVERLIGGHQLSRRDVLKALGAGSLTLAGGGLLEACGSLGNTGGTSSAGTIKIGFVSPLTGPAAGFGEPDPYVVSPGPEGVREAASPSAARSTTSRSSTRTASRDPRRAQVAERPDQHARTST